jgi:hypothetical protein
LSVTGKMGVSLTALPGFESFDGMWLRPVWVLRDGNLRAWPGLLINGKRMDPARDEGIEPLMLWTTEDVHEIPVLKRPYLLLRRKFTRKDARS